MAQPPFKALVTDAMGLALADYRLNGFRDHTVCCQYHGEEGVGSYGWTFKDVMAVVDAVSAKKISLEQIVTSVISLDELPSIFERLYSNDNADIKGVIKLWQKHQYPRVCIAEQI